MSINGNQPHLDLQGQNALSMPDIQIEQAPKTGQYQVKEGKLVRTDPITGQEKVYNVKVGGVAAQGSQLETIAKLFNEQTLPDLTLEKGQTFTAKLKYDPDSGAASKVTYYTKNQDGKLVGEKTRIDQKSENFSQIATHLKTLTSKVDAVGTHTLSGKDKAPPQAAAKETQHAHRGQILDLEAPDAPKQAISTSTFNQSTIDLLSSDDDDLEAEPADSDETLLESADTPELEQDVEAADASANQATPASTTFNQTTIDLLFSDDEELEAESADSYEQLQETAATPEHEQSIEATDESATPAISTPSPSLGRLTSELLSTLDDEESEEPTEALYDTNSPELSEGAEAAHSRESVVVAKNDGNKEIFNFAKGIKNTFDQLSNDVQSVAKALTNYQNTSSSTNFQTEIKNLNILNESTSKILGKLSEALTNETIDATKLVALIQSDDFQTLVSNTTTCTQMLDGLTQKLNTPDTSGNSPAQTIQKQTKMDIVSTSSKPARTIMQIKLILEEMEKKTPETSAEKSLFKQALELTKGYATEMNVAMRLPLTISELNTLNRLIEQCKDPKNRIALKDGNLEIRRKGITSTTNQTVKAGGAAKILEVLENAKKAGLDTSEQEAWLEKNMPKPKEPGMASA